jgi:hypothetical protein
MSCNRSFSIKRTRNHYTLYVRGLLNMLRDGVIAVNANTTTLLRGINVDVPMTRYV